MSNFHKLNLNGYYNCKLVYDDLPKSGEFGFDNICILKSDFKFNENEIIDGVEFRFYNGSFDNVVCNGQEISINKSAAKLHFINFAYWGDTNEFIKVVYADGDEETVKIPFIDWSYEYKHDRQLENFYGGVNTVKIMLSSGALIHPVYFYHTACNLNKNAVVEKIILPDNMFTHIFALSIEE